MRGTGRGEANPGAALEGSGGARRPLGCRGSLAPPRPAPACLAWPSRSVARARTIPDPGTRQSLGAAMAQHFSLAACDVVGFDLDHTLCRYNLPESAPVSGTGLPGTRDGPLPWRLRQSGRRARTQTPPTRWGGSARNSRPSRSAAAWASLRGAELEGGAKMRGGGDGSVIGAVCRSQALELLCKSFWAQATRIFRVCTILNGLTITCQSYSQEGILWCMRKSTARKSQ